jgi:putative SOS response-associated peptidase YedK
MCGRAYSTYTAEELYFQFLNKQALKIEPLKPNFNMSPTHSTLISSAAIVERNFVKFARGKNGVLKIVDTQHEIPAMPTCGKFSKGLIESSGRSMS